MNDGNVDIHSRSAVYDHLRAQHDYPRKMALAESMVSGTTQDALLNDWDIGRSVQESHDGERLATMVATTIGTLKQDTTVTVSRILEFEQVYDQGSRRITAIYSFDGRLADFYDELKETPKYVGPIPYLQDGDTVVTITIRTTSDGRDYPHKRYDLVISRS